MPNAIFALTRGSLPLLVSIPHAGTHIPDALHGALTQRFVDRRTAVLLRDGFHYVMRVGATSNVVAVPKSTTIRSARARKRSQR